MSCQHSIMHILIPGASVRPQPNTHTHTHTPLRVQRGGSRDTHPFNPSWNIGTPGWYWQAVDVLFAWSNVSLQPLLVHESPRKDVNAVWKGHSSNGNYVTQKRKRYLLFAVQKIHQTCLLTLWKVQFHPSVQLGFAKINRKAVFQRHITLQILRWDTLDWASAISPFVSHCTPQQTPGRAWAIGLQN